MEIGEKDRAFAYLVLISLMNAFEEKRTKCTHEFPNY